MCEDKNSKNQRDDVISSALFTGQKNSVDTVDKLQKEKNTKELTVFKELLENGIITSEWLREKADEMQKEKNKRILQSHPYKIYESNGTWYTHLPDSGKTEKRRKIKRKSKQALEKAIVDYYTSHENQMTVEDIFNAWNDDRLKYGYIAGSTHLRDKKFFKQYLMPTPMASRQIDSVSREEWTAWTQAQLDNGITAKQWSGLRGIIKGILHYAEDHHYIPYSAEDMLQRVRIHKNAFKKRRKQDAEEIYYAEDLQKLRDYCLKEWDAYTSCIWLISISGLRVGEVTSLTPDDIDLTAMTIYVHRTETRGDETGQTLATVRDGAKTDAGTREVSLPSSSRERLAQILWNCKNNNWQFLFCRMNGDRIKTRAIRRKLSIICSNLGIEYKPPHKLRKTVASILIESNAIDDRTITQQLGHTDISTTHDFYHRSRLKAKERSEILDGIAEIGASQKTS